MKGAKGCCFIFLSCSSSPYSTDEHSGIITYVWIKARIEDPDVYEGECEPDAGSLESIQMMYALCFMAI